jgi:glycosyltransferase involved in cell wall biosynthesis
MKIGIYANLHPHAAFGGVQTYLGALIKALGRLDGPEQYVVFGPAAHMDWLEALRGPNQLLVPLTHSPRGLGTRVVGRLQRELSPLGRRLPRLPAFSKGGPDFVRPPPDDLVGTAMLSTGKIEAHGISAIHFPYQEFVVTSVPSIFNPHDLQHLHFPQYFTPETILSRECRYRFACRTATHIAVHTEWIAGDLCEKYALPRSKVTVIPWAAPIGAYPAPAESDVAAIRREYSLPERFIFYPAVAWPHKNHASLIAALRLLADSGHVVHLVCSGARVDRTAELERYAASLGMEGQVRFLGSVPSERLRAVYRAAAAVVVPSLFEAGSGPVPEAWQEDVPAACSNIPQACEDAGDAALYFDPYSTAAIADAILKVLNDAGLRDELVRRGRRRLERFAWETVAARYRDLYRRAAGRAVAMNRL